jgi:hypothetical protein
VRNRSAPSPVFNSGGDGKFHEHRQSFSFSRTRRWPYQQDVRLEKKSHSEQRYSRANGLPGFRPTFDCLVRRAPTGPVLRIECAEGCRDGWPDAYDAFLYSGAKQCNPKIAAKEQLRAAHRGRAPGMGRAINLHLLDRRPCIVHAAAPTRSVTVFVHPRL